VQGALKFTFFFRIHINAEGSKGKSRMGKTVLKPGPAFKNEDIFQKNTHKTLTLSYQRPFSGFTETNLI